MKNEQTKKLVTVSLLVATVVVLQMLGSFIKFGPFSISLTLVPIVIGAALFGPSTGAILGFVFSVIVLITDAGAFLAYSIVGTVITVLTKGTLAGYVAGLVYRKFEEKQNLAVLLASIAAPVTNTGLFVIGCFIFFVPLLATWSGGSNVVSYVMFTMIGINFVIEMVINVALSNAIVRLINVAKMNKKN